MDNTAVIPCDAKKMHVVELQLVSAAANGPADSFADEEFVVAAVVVVDEERVVPDVVAEIVGRVGGVVEALMFDVMQPTFVVVVVVAAEEEVMVQPKVVFQQNEHNLVEVDQEDMNMAMMVAIYAEDNHY